MTDPSRPATGYPAPPHNGYPPPPPPPHSNYYYPNHNPYHAPPPYQPPRAAFFRRFFAAMIAVFIIFGTILFIVWLVLRPRMPKFTVDSLSVSSFNVSSSQIFGTWDVRFTVSNPNDKLHLYYDEIKASLYYHASPIAQNQLPPFDQGTKSQSPMVAKLVADSVYIDSKSVGDINGDRSKGSVNFDVQVLAIVKFKSGGWRARRRVLRADCEDLPVQIKSNGSNGTLSGGSHRCAVDI